MNMNMNINREVRKVQDHGKAVEQENLDHLFKTEKESEEIKKEDE